MHRHPGDVLVREAPAPGGWRDVPGNDREQRALARAVGTDHPDQFALADFHRNVVQRLEAAEAGAQPFDRKQPPRR
ncbi:hypothetical protein G6F57_023327 [Rhizopus arrhizus]|nr:hypothetical protein G6F57_023327 [Rhizopus arrhizus]